MKNWTYEQKRNYFKEIGFWETYLISKDQDHPLYCEAHEYQDEKNE